MCQHSNPIMLVSTIISRILLSLKYSRGKLNVCFLLMSHMTQSKIDLVIKILQKMSKCGKLQWFCSQLYKFFFSVKQVHIEPHIVGSNSQNSHFLMLFWFLESKQFPSWSNSTYGKHKKPLHIDLNFQSSQLKYIFIIIYFRNSYRKYPFPLGYMFPDLYFYKIAEFTF